MRITTPAFGFLSGFSTSLGLLPHILVLIMLLITRAQSYTVTSLVAFTIGAKLLGEWMFWKNCISRFNEEKKFKNWKSVVNQSLLSHPNVSLSIFMMLTDFFVDGFLVYLAFKTTIPTIWIFLSLLGCQALSAPIQGLLSDSFSQKKSLLFACVTALLLAAYTSTMQFDDQTFDYAKQMLFILCAKGLLSNLGVIARAAIAEVIKVEALKS